MGSVLRIANAGGFWGDRIDAAAELVRQQPELDFITIDYLAEVSMSILARQQERDPSTGYAADFIETMKLLAPALRDGSSVRIIVNAGGLNPRGCGEACAQVLRNVGCQRRIAIVSGDDVLSEMRAINVTFAARSDPFRNIETGDSLDAVIPRLTTANAYLGAGAIVEALEAGADIVITGRVADPSLTVAACLAHFGWKPNDYNRVAGATVAGHLIECGTQVCGGISTDWLDVPAPARIGFPIIEMHENGEFVVTKPPGTGGRVDLLTVKEQLLYEIGDPENYLSPDATVSFLSLRLNSDGEDRVRVSDAKGLPPPPTYKVSATYREGFRASGMLTLYGHNAYLKARRSAEAIRQRLIDRGNEPQKWLVECIGAGSVVPLSEPHQDAMEVALRISVADERRHVVEQFSRELVPLVTTGPQGTTGYFEGRPKVREVFGYWPCLIDRSAITPCWEMITG